MPPIARVVVFACLFLAVLRGGVILLLQRAAGAGDRELLAVPAADPGAPAGPAPRRAASRAPAEPGETAGFPPAERAKAGWMLDSLDAAVRAMTADTCRGRLRWLAEDDPWALSGTGNPSSHTTPGTWCGSAQRWVW